MKKKIHNIDDLKRIILTLKKKNKKVALCHGVFDLLHPGHIHHFEEAKKNSDILVVSITSDEKVIKGPGRPYFNKKLRMHSLASLECVDYVVSSEEKSAIDIIKNIKPDLYVKGKEYQKFEDDITGKINLEINEVKKNKGKILFTNGPTFSSSKILNDEFFFNESQSSFIKKLKSKYNSKMIIECLDKVSKNTPLVIGEAIIDEYVFCSAVGKSGKEAYLVMQEKKSEIYLGGVLSIAQNLSSISKNINLITTLGSVKSFKDKILKNLKKNINLIYNIKKNSPTIVKKRFIEEIDNVKMLGIYTLSEEPSSEKEDKFLVKKFKILSNKSDLIILSDYGHGFFNKSLVKEIHKTNKFLAINAQVNSSSIGYHSITKYKKADLILMNERELRHEFRDKTSSRAELIRKLATRIKCKYIAITHGKNGATIFSTKNKELTHVPAFAKKVVDKVGAGDSLFPILATCLRLNLPTDISLFIGSIAAAINAESHASKDTLDSIYFKKFIEHSLK